MTDAPPVPIRRALVSVYDKFGLADLAVALHQLGVTIISTGSTAAAIRAVGAPVVEVSEVTGFPEILDGRVKTLHPGVHAGILADRAKPEHLATIAGLGIDQIDLVIVNLYPFTSDPSIELIDVGGPTMVRAAAKNHAAVTVVVDAADYPRVLEDIAAHGGVSAQTRRDLAGKAFAHTADYDRAVAAWFAGAGAEGRAQAVSTDHFPAVLTSSFTRAQTLRYGENPHQAAAWYLDDDAWGLGSARQLQGKELSYNNLLDADAAWGLVADLADPGVVIVKHTNPAGAAVAEDLADAYPEALAGDPVSAFGGIVAVNRELDEATARMIVEVFTEVVVAPSYTAGALAVLSARANLRLLSVQRPQGPARPLAMRSISGGLLVQEADTVAVDRSAWTVPTRAQPDAATLDELAFAWQVGKHTKSNAIVLTARRAVVGVGAGQMSRVDSVRIAVEKSQGRSAGAVLASDAFFPFADGPVAALDAGVVAMISPGGSVRDAEVVAACDERGVPMVFTGRRHFRH